MYNSGDAAEQIVRISLEGTEVALGGKEYRRHAVRCSEKPR